VNDRHPPAGPADAPVPTAHGTALEVFLAFARLGLTSFGGPVAHLGYFRNEFVTRRRWLAEADYAEMVAVAQALPGPASSKVGFTLGLRRAGLAGALAAWVAFTLPSALALYAFALGAARFADAPGGRGLLHGLQLAAVAIVAHAVVGMARTLCPDAWRRLLAAVAALAVVATGPGGQLLAIALGAACGALMMRRAAGAAAAPSPAGVPPRAGMFAALAFLALLAAAFASTGTGVAGMAAAFYRSGALVFGGGHVVLPLLDAAVVGPGWIAPTEFLAGYGAAQAVPGPLFAFAAFLGAQPGMPQPGAAGAALALVAIFLPGLLLQIAALSSWSALRRRPLAGAAIAGVNAAVVGVLAAALWDPVWTGTVRGLADAGIAVAGFALLLHGRAPPLAVVLATALAGVALAGAGG
jgi:chromate transporter